jgi:hypothetical protein
MQPFLKEHFSFFNKVKNKSFKENERLQMTLSSEEEMS